MLENFLHVYVNQYLDFFIQNNFQEILEILMLVIDQYYEISPLSHNIAVSLSLHTNINLHFILSLVSFILISPKTIKQSDLELVNHIAVLLIKI